MAFLVFLPGMLLAYFPMKQHLRLRPAKLAAATVSLILSLILAGESVRFLFHVDILWLFFPAAAVMGCFYIHTLCQCIPCRVWRFFLPRKCRHRD